MLILHHKQRINEIEKFQNSFFETKFFFIAHFFAEPLFRFIELALLPVDWRIWLPVWLGWNSPAIIDRRFFSPGACDWLGIDTKGIFDTPKDLIKQLAPAANCPNILCKNKFGAFFSNFCLTQYQLPTMWALKPLTLTWFMLRPRGSRASLTSTRCSRRAATVVTEWTVWSVFAVCCCVFLTLVVCSARIVLVKSCAVPLRPK